MRSRYRAGGVECPHILETCRAWSIGSFPEAAQKTVGSARGQAGTYTTDPLSPPWGKSRSITLSPRHVRSNPEGLARRVSWCALTCAVWKIIQAQHKGHLAIRRAPTRRYRAAAKSFRSVCVTPVLHAARQMRRCGFGESRTLLGPSTGSLSSSFSSSNESPAHPWCESSAEVGFSPISKAQSSL